MSVCSPSRRPMVGNAPTPQGLSQIVAPYQSLPTRETKPKTMWSCMCFTLPKLTGSCARGANAIGAFGLVRGPLTIPYQLTVLAVCHYNIVLPIITGRGVKYTHNDINDTVLHPDSGPARIRLIPQASNQKEIAPPQPHDPQSILGQGPVALPPRPPRLWRTV